MNAADGWLDVVPRLAMAGVSPQWLEPPRRLPEVMVMLERVERLKMKDAADSATLMEAAIKAALDGKAGKAFHTMLKKLGGD